MRGLVLAWFGMLSAASVVGQIPAKFTNLKILPADIKRDSLIGIMRGFSLALGVRCQYCHVGGDGVSFEGVEFAKDDDVDKQRARFMLRMVDSLNRFVLPAMPAKGGAQVAIECKTCHRGGPRPLLLTQELELLRDSAGIGSALERYRKLRESDLSSGRYDFGEWEMNLWAERLEAARRPAEAIAVYELNLEFFPKSASILGTLGRLYERTDRRRAIEYWERALAIAPRPDIRRRVDSLKAVPQQ